jgi:hypothetical protein
MYKQKGLLEKKEPTTPQPSDGTTAGTPKQDNQKEEQRRGVMDDLISSLRTGNAYKAKATRRVASGTGVSIPGTPESGRSFSQSKSEKPALDANALLANIRLDE